MERSGTPGQQQIDSTSPRQRATADQGSFFINVVSFVAAAARSGRLKNSNAIELGLTAPGFMLSPRLRGLPTTNAK